MNAGNVDARVKGGEGTLLGTVERREEKRAMEDVAEGVLGVKEVHNPLRVSRPGERGGTQGQTTQGRADTPRSDTQAPRPGTPPMHS